MGEIADLMINGALCELCGAVIGDEVGYPRKCRGCQPKKSTSRIKPGKTTGKFHCRTCGKGLKSVEGLNTHMALVHRVITDYQKS